MVAEEFSPIDQARNLANKRFILAKQQEITRAPRAELGAAIAAAYEPEAPFHGTHPVNDIAGYAAIEGEFWAPLRRALPDVERREDILAGGLYQGKEWVACSGHYLGTFTTDWFGIPATRQPLLVRFCEAHELAGERIARSFVHLDYLDVMRQAGYWPLAPSLGQEGAWLPPMTHDGLLLTAQDEEASSRCFQLMRAMQMALGYYSSRPPTRAVLDEMVQARFWHPQMMWYGPSGIGMTRGLRGFEDFHQIPFLVAFPDRGKLKGQGYRGHFIRISDGHYAVTGGWGHLLATHSGGEWLGLAPTGRAVAMRVMDFYRCEEGSDGALTIRENWVPIDIPHILHQLGVDVFGRLRHQFRQAGVLSASEFLIP